MLANLDKESFKMELFIITETLKTRQLIKNYNNKLNDLLEMEIQ